MSQYDELMGRVNAVMAEYVVRAKRAQESGIEMISDGVVITPQGPSRTVRPSGWPAGAGAGDGAG